MGLLSYSFVTVTLVADQTVKVEVAVTR